MARARAKTRHGVSAGQVFDVFASGKDALKDADARVLVRVHVDFGCSRDLALAVKRLLRAERAGGVVEVCGMALPSAAAELPDAVVALTAGATAAVETVGFYARCGVPVAQVVEGALDAVNVDLPPEAAACASVIAAASPEALEPKLADWLAGAVENPLALAASFAFCRRPVADALAQRCALENAAVGAVSLIPGSDLPIMCVNQAKLALDVAAAYGRRLDAARALELLGVVGAGFCYRSLARGVVGLLPGLGLVLKAGIGYGGTLATANALCLRFEAEDGTVDLGAAGGLLARVRGRQNPREAGGEPGGEGLLAVRRVAAAAGWGAGKATSGDKPAPLASKNGSDLGSVASEADGPDDTEYLTIDGSNA